MLASFSAVQQQIRLAQMDLGSKGSESRRLGNLGFVVYDLGS